MADDGLHPANPNEGEGIPLDTLLMLVARLGESTGYGDCLDHEDVEGLPGFEGRPEALPQASEP